MTTRLDDYALDGNAIGGLLIEVFGTEMTTATGTCGGCGAVWPGGRTRRLPAGARHRGALPSCDTVLMTFVQIHGVTCVDLMGLASLT